MDIIKHMMFEVNPVLSYDDNDASCVNWLCKIHFGFYVNN